MKRILFLAASLALCGCSAITAATNGQPLATGDVALDMHKGFADVEIAYNVVASAYKSANTRGLVTAAAKPTIKADLILLWKLVGDLKHARDAGDATTFSQKLAAFNQLKTDVTALIPKAPTP